MTNGVDLLWPGNRLPVTILLDDPTPCRNPMWYEFPDDGHEAVVPFGFTERFVELIERSGAAGKFSLVPCPGAQGRIDRDVPGVPHEDLARFLRLVRERIAPRWSIGPEMLTHNRAIDIDTGEILPEREDAWAARQDRQALTRYIARALQILRNAGLQPTGVTSPWSFGVEIEDAYADAIAAALQEVCAVRIGWYFLHSDTTSRSLAPRTMRLDEARASALISIVSGQRDWLWGTQFGRPAAIDDLLSADGASGRLADLFAARSQIVITTHWQSLFSNGSGAGIEALGRLCERIDRLWGGRVRWTSAHEIARYCAAGAALHVAAGEGGRTLRLTSPFACPALTCAVPLPPGATALYGDDGPMERRPDGQLELDEGCWARAGDRARVCLHLRGSAELSWRGRDVAAG